MTYPSLRLLFLRIGVPGLILCGLLALAPPVALTGAAKTEVFVVGTLYRRHETVSTYDVATLRRIIAAIKPDVLVVDCTPQEVRARTVHASKVEYQQVIFPMIRAGGYKVYPAEPDQPLFGEIVQAVAAAHQTFQKTKPAEAAALQAFVTATYEVLATHWRSPAEVNDEVTGRVLAAKKVLEGQLVGPVEADGSRRWNQHWTESIRRAVVENPGARVLALTGIENRPWIVEALATAPDIELIDIPRWLAAHAR